MKRYVIFVFLIMSILSFSEIKPLKTLRTLKFDVNEKVSVNSNNKEIQYKIDFELPRKIRKEITFPDLNRGEIYIYDGSVKKIYLPLFEEYKEVKTDKEENKVIETINKIIILEEHDANFKRNYLSKKIQNIALEDGGEIAIKSYQEVNSYILPKIVEIIDNGVKIAEIELKNIEVNPTLDKQIFEIEQRQK